MNSLIENYALKILKFTPRNFINFSLFFLSIISGCEPKLPSEIEEVMQTLPKEIDYNFHVKPILSDKCFACHGPDQKKQKAGLRLDIQENAFASLKDSPGKVAIEPGSWRDSELYYRITTTDPEKIMPAKGSHLSLSNYEKAVLLKWIKQGAKYKQHWAFVKPEKIDLPKVQNDKWVKNPIDHFILKKLEEKNLNPAPLASKEILLRRLSFDLTGLPPTIVEIDNFIKDNSENAYEKVVDRLLNSQNYGERMATDWLDVARFADSHGYTVDRLRDMSPYRDWVIKAFNTNQSFDKFIHWQLAGDLMPKPTKEMLIATAFNRNHPQNTEGGIVEEEFQTEYVLDRTNTLGDAFLGLSVGCAKCHDHKYDPISQKNYYELYSFFNNVREAGQISYDDAMPTPTLMLPTPEQEKILKFIKNQISEEEIIAQSIYKNGQKDFQNWLNMSSYKKLANETLPKAGLIGQYTFEKNGLENKVNPKEKSFITTETGKIEIPNFVAGKTDKALKLNGDAWLTLDKIGVFGKSDPFSVSLWLNVPKDFNEGVIFHKSFAERLYNYKGFHLLIRKNGCFEATMAHTAPSNAFTKVSKIKIPKEKWINLTMTYDGSSMAQGMKIFLDGTELEMTTEIDQLSKDILFTNSKNPPALQFGAWWRGYGIKNGLIDDILVYNRAISSFEVGIIAGKNNWNNTVSKAPGQFTKNEIAQLENYYFATQYQPSIDQFKKIKAKKIALSDSTEPISEIMVMQEMPIPKQSYILNRGNYASFGEKVYPNTPEKIFKFASNLPKNRFGLAQWLTNPNHPLTARVAVNRFWQNIFGVGIVKTSEDFGNQGELPSHLELLDYLALSFIETGWDVKKLIKLMVMSATYQQDSKASKEKSLLDPENRLLARGPVNRLTAEMIRDNALFASELLKNKIGGKSVKPYQPVGLWEINNTTYKPDSTDEVYRRSLYMVIKRSVPHPTLGTFDGPSRSVCTNRRQKTNTPLQALVTLNDPAFVEASKVLGEKMASEKDEKTALILAYRKLTGLLPNNKEIQLLTALFNNEYLKFKQFPQKTKGWLSAGFYKINENLDPNLVAAYTVVANVIMNSDACLTKR
jgi:Protein of unknown function (DUF1553)/Protein of unknown function (DUF1549)/Concanavalin A-like lectin/glucanases superfamily/Planctomycete cytochrome C